MSGGGGGGGSNDAVDYQREQEEARQARIRQGMTQIDEIFNGKDVFTGVTGGFNPKLAGGVGNGTYYDKSGRAYTVANGDASNGGNGNVRWTGTASPGTPPSAARLQYNDNGNWTDMPSEIYSGRDMSQQLSGATINPNAAGLGNGTFYGPDGKAYSVKNGDASNNYYGNVRWTGGSPGRQTPGAVMQYGAGKSWANLPDQLYTGYNPAAGLTGAINPSTAGIGDGTFYDATGKVYNVQNGNASNNNFGNVRWAGTSHPGKGPEFAHLQYLNNGNWEDVPDELYTGTTTEHQGGFDDAVFNKRKQAYVDYAMPQLQDQYADQRKALTYALSRGGNLGSSLAASKSAALNKDYSLQQQSVYDTGQDYVNKAKSEMAQQKANLVSMLQATADPDAVANVAQSQVAAASAMPTFSPLSPVISNVASGLGTYLSNQQTADAIRKATGGDSYTNSLSRTSGKVG